MQKPPKYHKVFSYFSSPRPKASKKTPTSHFLVYILVTDVCPTWEITLTATAGPAKEMKEQEQLWDKAADKNSCIKPLQCHFADVHRNAECIHSPTHLHFEFDRIFTVNWN